MASSDLAVQRALAAEIRRLMAPMDMNHSQLAAAAGISPSAYRTYFRTFERDVPMRALLAIAQVLEVPASQMMRKAEASAADFENRP